jgi:integrase
MIASVSQYIQGRRQMAQLSDNAQDHIKLRYWQSKADKGKAPWLVEFGGEKKFFATEAEAQAHRDQIIRDEESGGHITKSNKVSFSFAAEEFEKDLEKDKRNGLLSAAHRRNSGCAIRALSAVSIDGKPLNDWLVPDLTTGHVQFDILPQLAEGRKRATVQRYLCTLTALFGFAILKGWAKHNPCRETSIKKIIAREAGIDKAEKIGGNVMSAIVAAAGKWSLHISFAKSTGLRAGEQRALCWRHIDFDRGFVSVKQAAKFDNSIGVPKTKAGIREVPLQDNILSALREHRLASAFAGDDDLVFPNLTGGVLNMTMLLQNALLPACRKAGVDPIRWHDLRHYYASKLLEVMQDEQWTVSRLLGHESTDTTTKIYGHWLRSDEKDRALKDRHNTIQF